MFKDRLHKLILEGSLGFQRMKRRLYSTNFHPSGKSVSLEAAKKMVDRYKSYGIDKDTNAENISYQKKKIRKERNTKPEMSRLDKYKFTKGYFNGPVSKPEPHPTKKGK